MRELNLKAFIMIQQAIIDRYKKLAAEDGKYDYAEEISQHQDIIDACAKQIAQTVIHDKSQNVYNCPACKGYIKEDEYFGYPIGEDENHCKLCGQKLKWN